MAEEKKPARKFKKIERKAEVPQYGDFVKFESLGDSIEGTLKGVRVNPARTVGEQRFKAQKLYDLEADDGQLFTVNGNFDLDDKLGRVKKGSYVKIIYATDEDVGTGDKLSPMKVFDVEVAS